MTTETNTSSSDSNTVLTLDMVKEAKALLEALAPKQAPADLSIIQGVTGIKIMKSDILPQDTIVVSKAMFDLIFDAMDGE